MKIEKEKTDKGLIELKQTHMSEDFFFFYIFHFVDGLEFWHPRKVRKMEKEIKRSSCFFWIMMMIEFAGYLNALFLIPTKAYPQFMSATKRRTIILEKVREDISYTQPISS